jgi:hypothetical protein
MLPRTFTCNAFTADRISFRCLTPVFAFSRRARSFFCELSARETPGLRCPQDEGGRTPFQGRTVAALVGPPRTPPVLQPLTQQRDLRSPGCFGRQMRFDAGRRVNGLSSEAYFRSIVELQHALSQVPCRTLIRPLFRKDDSLFATNEFPVRARREFC